MSDLKNKKIIVIGGSGETGKRILSYLHYTHPSITLACAARRNKNNDEISSIADIIKLDVNEGKKAHEILKNYDLAIIALGPMDKFGAKVHRLCLRAKVSVIDINDNLAAADEIFSLHSEAQKQKVGVFTGMGFSPGISSLLLMELADQEASPEGSYHCRLYMGAAYGGGETSPYAMLASFKNELSKLVNGARKVVKTPWNDKNSSFKFPSQKKSLGLIPFATPEIAGLTFKERVSSQHVIKTFDSRYHIQFLSKGMAKFMAKFKLSQNKTNFFAKKFYAGGQSMKAKKESDPDTTLWVYPDEYPEKGLLIHGVISSYDLTALMATAVANQWLSGSLQQYKGVFATEHLSGEIRKDLLQTLSKWGVNSRIADQLNQNEADNYFGWSDGLVLSVPELRNYSKNWYSVEKPHPKMAGLQQRFLFESEIWASLKENLTTFQLTKFVIKTLYTWKKDNKDFQKYTNHSNALKAERWKKITKDMSMFTSGYGCAKVVLGAEKAEVLYRKMFLETGKMEMRWLWPKPETFSAMPNPESAIIEYWLAFMENYAHLGLFSLHIEKTTTELSCEVTDCAYAKMFTEKGYNELSGMVREMEQEALSFISKYSLLSIDWSIKPNGAATILIRNNNAEVISTKVI
jgi:hypothetical protein